MLKKKKDKPEEQIGQLAVKIPAIEWEPVEETKESKKRHEESLVESNWWVKMCRCTHSRTAHKTVGTGKCMITDCDCEIFE